MTDFFDFMTSGGDDLLNSRQCPHCKAWFSLDAVKKVPSGENLVQCPRCGKTVSSR